MNFLLAIAAAADRVAVTQTNFQRLDESLAFMLAPTKVAGVANALVGPPDSGAHVLHELWVDSLGAIFRCTVAGTTGTWVQVGETVVADSTARDAISAPPAGYRVVTADDGLRFIWDGDSWEAA